jgi:hypothetical protein
MAQFLRHIGKVGDRKVAVIFREIPNETHMALVVYSELLNQNIHDPLMAAIESPQGQQAKDLADALNRAYTKDGKVILQVLHLEGMMKKIQTNQVVMTPAPGTTIRLNELNTMLDEMDKGEAAVKRMAEIDASRGLQDPADVARRMRGEATVDQPVNPVASPDGTLGDDTLAQSLRAQAARMAAEARGLLAESERLEKQAAEMMPQINTTVAVTESAPKKKAGRPKKAAVAG